MGRGWTQSASFPKRPILVHPRVSISGKKFLSLLSPGWNCARFFERSDIIALLDVRAPSEHSRKASSSFVLSHSLAALFILFSDPCTSYSSLPFFFIIGQRSTSKWFFGALRFHDDGTEQCAGLIPTACSFARNRGKGKIVASPPGDPLRFAGRVGGLDDNWRICEIMHDDEAACLFVEMPLPRILRRIKLISTCNNCCDEKEFLSASEKTN